MTRLHVTALSVLGVFLLAGCSRAPRPSEITPEQKEEFVKLLRTLPTRAEFFADEGIRMTKPYLPHLLSFTEEDVKRFFDGEVYAIAVLSTGMAEDADNVARAAASFREIGHPVVRSIWARAILDTQRPPAEVIEYVRKGVEPDGAIASIAPPAHVRYLKERLGELGAGPRQDLTNVPRLDSTAPAAPAGHAACVKLVSRSDVSAVPRYSSVFAYKSEMCSFGPDRRLHCLRPAKFGGTLCSVDLGANIVHETPLPQPRGLKQEYDFKPYFSDPQLRISERGDILAWWMLGGNGDQAVALRPHGKKAFVVARTSQTRPIAMADSKAIWTADGQPYMLVWSASSAQDLNLSVYRVSDAAVLKLVSRYHGPGHHSINVVDAVVVDNSRIVVIWTDIDGNRDDRLRVWTTQLDLKSKQWSERQMLARHDGFTSISSSRVFVLPDGSVHFLWYGDDAGIFYLKHGDKTPTKIALPSYWGFQAIQTAHSIIVVYSTKAMPSKAFFRVIQNGKPGPETSIDLKDQPDYPLAPEYMILGPADDDKIWFFPSTNKSAYLLKLTTTSASHNK